MKFREAFTLIELMIVIAIVALLAMVAIPSFKNYLARAKRTEAYALLSSLATAQKTYWAEHGKYSSTLSGPDGIGWKPEGYASGQESNFYYTYGFPGSEGVNHFTGKLGTAGSQLSQAQAGQDSFVAVAAGDIDGDGTPDILTVDQSGKITVVQDDLE